MTTTNNMVAKIAAAVAGFGLVIAGFAPMAQAQSNDDAAMQAQIAALMAQIAALQAQSGGSASASMTFTRDLTIGSTGADVTALQNWLIKGGYSIPAGATGYFGAQTAAAVAKYQAANGISPAAGYFGPITRAKVNASAGGSTGGSDDNDDDDDNSDNSDDDGDLEGGEADLSDFEFNDEESEGSEGEEMVDIATLEFDVEDGDVRVERVEFIASSTSSNQALEKQPWDYFETLYLLDEEGDVVGEIDASDRDEWDEEEDDDVYRIVFTDVDTIVSEDDRAMFTLSADIAQNIDTADQAQDFDFYVPDDGVRAVDSEGIDHYIPSTDSEEVSFGFDEEESGDLDLSTSSEDPDSTTLVADEDDESEAYSVFAFELENNDDVEVLVTDITIDVATSSGDSIDDLLQDATLEVDGEEYDGDINDNGTIDFEDIDVTIGGDETVEFVLMVTLKEDADGATVTFSLDAADVDAEGEESGDDADVSGSADGETHTIALSGIVATNGETTASSDVINTTTGSEEGDFSITFDVEALEEDVYIYKGASNASSTDAGVIYTVYQDNSATTTVVTSAQATDNLEANDSDNGDTSDYFIVRSGDTRSFTLEVSINPVTTGFYKVELESIRFDETEDASAVDDEFYSVPDTDDYETDAEQLNA